MLLQWINSIYRSSIQNDNIHWNHLVNKLNEESLLSIEHYDLAKKRFDDAKIFMQCMVYKNQVDKQKKDFKDSTTMCLINQLQYEKSTQTMNDKKLYVPNESQLMDDIIIKLEQFHLN